MKIQVDLFKRQLQDPKPYMEASAFAAMYDGGHRILAHILEGDDYYFGRQKLEDDRHRYYREEEKFLAITNEKNALYQAVVENNGYGNREKKFNDYLSARWEMYANSGARQAIQKLIDECDMRVVPEEMRLEIKDDETVVLTQHT